MAVEMRGAPSLSICIANWNTCQLLRNCLTSIYNDPQAVEWEVIVVDNASSDSSVEMVKTHFPQVRLIASKENLGFARSSNLAMEQASGPYLLLLNSDTQVEPGAVGPLIHFLEVNPQAGAVGPRLVGQDGALELSCGRPPGLGSECVNKLLLHKLFPFFKFGRWNHAETREVGWIAGACLMVRRAVLEKVGPLDPRMFMFYEDVDWCLRIRAAGWKIYYYPFSQVLHLGGQSTRQNFGEMLVVSQQSLYYLFEKHFGRRSLHLLRLLTLAEMGLRSLLWGGSSLLVPALRDEGRERLQAYREIFSRTLGDRAYWASFALRVGERTKKKNYGRAHTHF